MNNQAGNTLLHVRCANEIYPTLVSEYDLVIYYQLDFVSFNTYLQYTGLYILLDTWRSYNNSTMLLTVCDSVCLKYQIFQIFPTFSFLMHLKYAINTKQESLPQIWPHLQCAIYKQFILLTVFPAEL